MTAAKQSRVTGALALMISQSLVLLLGYITHPLVGRVLGPRQYGIYGVVLAVQTIAGLLLTLGVPTSLSRYVAQNESQAQGILRQALKLQTLITLVVSGLTLLLAPIIATVLDDTTLTPLLRFVALVVFAQSFYNIFTQFLSGMHRFNRQAVLTTFYAVVKLISAVGLLFVIGVYGAFAGFGIGGILAAGLGWFWARRMGGDKPSSVPTKSLLSFASLYVLTLFGLQIVMSLDLFMVKAFLHDDTLAGFYSAASTLGRIPYLLLQGIAFVILPSVSALTKPGADHNTAASFIRDTLRYLIGLIVPATALAAATSENLVTLFFSAQYAPASAPLTILMIGLGALAFYLLITNIVAGAGKAHVSLFVTMIMVAVSALAGYILIPRYNTIGAAWQTSIASVLGLVILSFYTFKTFRIPVPVISTANILIASSVAVSLTYLWQATPLTLIPQYIAAFLVYGAVLWLLGEIKPRDRHLVSRLHPKLKWIARY